MSDKATITLVAWALVALLPIVTGATWYTWNLHARSRRLDNRSPKPRLRLSLVLATTSTLALACALILVTASVFYLAGRIDLAQRLGSATLLVYVVLLLIPVINAAYLRWLEATGGKP